jgi:hypothetical protein
MTKYMHYLSKSKIIVYTGVCSRTEQQWALVLQKIFSEYLLPSTLLSKFGVTDSTSVFKKGSCI